MRIGYGGFVSIEVFCGIALIRTESCIFLPLLALHTHSAWTVNSGQRVWKRDRKIHNSFDFGANVNAIIRNIMHLHCGNAKLKRKIGIRNARASFTCYQLLVYNHWDHEFMVCLFFVFGMANAYVCTLHSIKFSISNAIVNIGWDGAGGWWKCAQESKSKRGNPKWAGCVARNAKIIVSTIMACREMFEYWKHTNRLHC